jgi:membrane protein implicated in regulation of membrane protease activity
MAPSRRARLALGSLPFLLIMVTLVAFLATRDTTVFALAGILAAVYVLAYFLLLRRRRRRRTRRERRR